MFLTFLVRMPHWLICLYNAYYLACAANPLRLTGTKVVMTPGGFILFSAKVCCVLLFLQILLFTQL